MPLETQQERGKASALILNETLGEFKLLVLFFFAAMLVASHLCRDAPYNKNPEPGGESGGDWSCWARLLIEKQERACPSAEGGEGSWDWETNRIQPTAAAQRERSAFCALPTSTR